MLTQQKRMRSIALIIMLAMLVPGAGGDAAPKKKAAIKPKQQDNYGTVPRKRVLKEFKEAFQVPPASKMTQSYHIGKIRNYKEARGEQKVPAQAHQVAVVLQLTDCAIKVHYLWEVSYYKLETEWIFQSIKQIQSKQLTWPKKKHPSLDESAIKNILAEGLANQYSGAEIRDVTVLQNKSTWRLCEPEFQVTSKVALALKDDVYNRQTRYECLFTSTLAQRNGRWAHIQSGCTYKGKPVPDCHIGTMCRELSAESTVPPLQDADAVALLRAAFEGEYGLKKNNAAVETFILTDKQPSEDFGKKIRCAMRTVFSMDEEKEIRDNSGVKAIRNVRAVYECAVYGYLRYSFEDKKWEGVIESCCPSDTEKCGLSCSSPRKGCRRLGEK
jgi:hypothetical protein